MAKYDVIPPVTGSFGRVCIYKMYGQYYFRMRSSLTGERVKKDPAFRKTMYFAALMGKASGVASTVYAGLPAACKEHSLYRKLTGEAMTWLKYGWEESEVLYLLQERYTPQKAFVFVHKEAVIAATEEDIAVRFMKRKNRGLLRAVRKGGIHALKRVLSGLALPSG